MLSSGVLCSCASHVQAFSWIRDNAEQWRERYEGSENCDTEEPKVNSGLNEIYQYIFTH
jgi:hypothetical protein